MGLIYIFGGFLALIAIGTAVHQARLSRHRGVPRDAFIDEFRRSNVPELIPATVYDYYKQLGAGKRFGVNADDSFERVFGQVHDDVDDDATRLVEKLGMQLPVESVLRQWPTEVKTLRDMVLWLNWVRQHQQ